MGVDHQHIIVQGVDQFLTMQNLCLLFDSLTICHRGCPFVFLGSLQVLDGFCQFILALQAGKMDFTLLSFLPCTDQEIWGPVVPLVDFRFTYTVVHLLQGHLTSIFMKGPLVHKLVCLCGYSRLLIFFCLWFSFPLNFLNCNTCISTSSCSCYITLI